MNTAIQTQDTKLITTLENIKKSLSELQDIQEISNIKNMASGFEEVWKKYYRSSGFGFEQMFLGWETKVRSERRMGELLANSDVPDKLGKLQLHDETVKLEDLGISKIQSHRYQQLSKTPEDKFNKKIEELRLSFTEPTTKLLLITITGAHVGFNTGEDEWYTPPEIIEAARKTMGNIDLDPASSEEANKIVKAKNIYTIENDGLSKSWLGNVWMNPPFSQIPEFTSKLVEEYFSGNIKQACAITLNGTETQWSQNTMKKCKVVCFPKGRISFLDKNLKPKPGSPLQGNTIFYFGDNASGFETNFKGFGIILWHKI